MIYRIGERAFAMILLICFLPLLALLYVLVRLESRGPFLFLQLRTGKDGGPFWMYKIRTMVEQAESLKSKVKSLNEADGPVFKIHNDPRFTRIGKILSRLALDELPQLMNIIEGNMAFVGPRPLPTAEAAAVPQKYQIRHSVLPGMTSSWVVEGAHRLSFKQWMELDVEYIRKRTVIGDFFILFQTIIIVTTTLLRLSFFRRSRTKAPQGGSIPPQK